MGEGGGQRSKDSIPLVFILGYPFSFWNVPSHIVPVRGWQLETSIRSRVICQTLRPQDWVPASAYRRQPHLHPHRITSSSKSQHSEGIGILLSPPLLSVLVLLPLPPSLPPSLSFQLLRFASSLFPNPSLSAIVHKSISPSGFFRFRLPPPPLLPGSSVAFQPGFTLHLSIFKIVVWIGDSKFLLLGLI